MVGAGATESVVAILLSVGKNGANVGEGTGGTVADVGEGTGGIVGGGTIAIVGRTVRGTVGGGTIAIVGGKVGGKVGGIVRLGFDWTPSSTFGTQSKGHSLARTCK